MAPPRMKRSRRRKRSRFACLLIVSKPRKNPPDTVDLFVSAALIQGTCPAAKLRKLVEIARGFKAAELGHSSSDVVHDRVVQGFRSAHLGMFSLQAQKIRVNLACELLYRQTG